MFTAISSLMEFLKSLCGLKQTDIENKTTLEVVRDKKCLKKGTNYAEKIIDLTDKYSKFFTNADLKRYNSLKRKFRNNN